MATLAAEPDQKVQATLWRGMTADKASGPALERFSAAVQRGAATTPCAPCGAVVAGSSRRRLRRASPGSPRRGQLHRSHNQEGEFDSARQDHQPERLAQRQALGHRRGLRP